MAQFEICNNKNSSKLLFLFSNFLSFIYFDHFLSFASFFFCFNLQYHFLALICLLYQSSYINCSIHIFIYSYNLFNSNLIHSIFLNLHFCNFFLIWFWSPGAWGKSSIIFILYDLISIYKIKCCIWIRRYHFNSTLQIFI